MSWPEEGVLPQILSGFHNSRSKSSHTSPRKLYIHTYTYTDIHIHILYIHIFIYTELGKLLTNCNQLIIPNYMTKFIVSKVIHYTFKVM